MEQWLFFEDGLLTKDQALAVVAKAKAYAGMLHRILARAHERRIWVPLGYGSWAEFCAAEFDVSRSRSYQMLDLAKVQAALGTGDEPGAPAPIDWDAEHLTEAQARPLAPFKGDRRTVRLIWARAREIAGPNDEPTKGNVEQAVAEWMNPALSDLWCSEERLVTGGVWLAPAPVWWHWSTPAEGVVLYLGLGDFPPTSQLDEHSNTWFRSEARYGDLVSIAAEDLETLVPRLIAELFARQVPAAEEVHEVGRLVADLGIDPAKRGPFRLDHEQVAGAFAELAHIYDDDYSWSDTSSHEPVDDAAAPAAVDPDDEVVDAEIIEDDEPTVSPADAAPGRRERLLERLRVVEAELAGDLPATRRLQLIQERLNLEAELDGRPAPRPAAPASRPPAAAPPTTTSPASVGNEEVGDDGRDVVPSSSTAPAPLKIPDDLPFDRMVADAISCMEAMLIWQRPGDLRHSARWLRAVASHLENEATRREAAQQEAGAA